MRLTAIELENFKGIGPRQRIELKPITLLFGPNSAGKSTILQALHYVREILERGNVDPDMTIAGGLLDLGGFKSVVHQHDLSRPLRFKLEMGPLAWTDEYCPLNWNGPDGAVGDFSDLDIGYFLPGGLVNDIALEIELRWSHQHLAPYVSRWAVQLNHEHVATITSVPEHGRAILSEFNFEHPLLLAADRDEDGTTFSPVENLLREFAWNVAIPEADVLLFPTELQIGVETKFGALPSLELGRERYFVSMPHSQEPDEDNSSRSSALAALLNEFMVSPARIIRDFLSTITYIGPLREIPGRDYRARLSPDPARWANGLAAWDLLHGPRGRELIEVVNFWLSDKEQLDSGYRLERIDFRMIPSPSPIDLIFQRGAHEEDLPDLKELFEQYPLKQEVVLRDMRTNTVVGPRDVGVGLSQLVPVIVRLVAYLGGVVAVEQPELHLHPRMQVGIGDLLAATANTGDPPLLLIETHSEHIMLRLLRRIRETTEGKLPPGAPPLTPDQVAVIYAEPTEDDLRFTALRITEDGDFIDRWPRGFFEERVSEVF